MRPIFCGNFEYETRQSDLERLFSKYGRVDRVDMKSGTIFYMAVSFSEHLLRLFSFFSDFVSEAGLILYSLIVINLFMYAYFTVICVKYSFTLCKCFWEVSMSASAFVYGGLSE